MFSKEDARCPHCDQTLPSLTYSAVHQRLQVRRGAAKNYFCVLCGEQASDWAYDHQDPEERTGTGRWADVRYSVLLHHYQPLCKSCHIQIDCSITEYCRSGKHRMSESAIFRKDGGRQCGICKNEQQALYRANKTKAEN